MLRAVVRAPLRSAKINAVAVERARHIKASTLAAAKLVARSHPLSPLSNVLSRTDLLGAQRQPRQALGSKRWHGGGHSHGPPVNFGPPNPSGPAPSAAQRAQDERMAKVVINIGAVSNVSLAVFKAIGGALTGSAALVADALHSLADLLSDLITYLTHYYARKGADSNFPHGYGRVEPLGALVVAGTLVAAGGSLGYQSLGILYNLARGEELHILFEHAAKATEFLSDPKLAAIAVVGTVGSVVVKEGLYRWTMDIARRLRSSVLAANAWHHRSDALSSVVAAAGVSGALMGYPALDPIAAVVVAAMIVQQGAKISWTSIEELLDKRTDTEVIGAVEQIIEQIPDITQFRRLRARKMGYYTIVDVEIGLRPHLTISGAHHVADDLRSRVLSARPDVQDVLVHTFPDDVAGSVFCADEGCVLPARVYGAPPEMQSAAHASSGSVAGGDAPRSHHETHTHSHSHSHGHTHSHDHGHSHGGSGVTSSAAASAGPIALPSPSVVEADVRKAVATVKDVRAITHLRLHYPAPAGSSTAGAGPLLSAANQKVRVEMEVLLRLDMRLKDAVGIVRRVRAAVEALPFISVADVHLEVDPA
jgi:cation diffusion facilitator family transporter